MMRLFVGNISHSLDEDGLRRWVLSMGYAVAEHPHSVVILRDRVTGHSRGFGFIEIETHESISDVIRALHGQKVSGRIMTVNEAHPKSNQSRSA